MGKNVSIISEEGVTHMHKEFSNSREKGEEATVEDSAFDPSGELKRVCISAFYLPICGDEKVIVGGFE